MNHIIQKKKKKCKIEKKWRDFKKKVAIFMKNFCFNYAKKINLIISLTVVIYLEGNVFIYTHAQRQID